MDGQTDRCTESGPREGISGQIVALTHLLPDGCVRGKSTTSQTTRGLQCCEEPL